ncbi:MAG: tRNA (5-methylaminomethyl-2-thiouridine)(34)-methyltransferase MnmD [Thermaceae bacterium]
MEWRLTEDGSPTLYHPFYGEAYHPRQGALRQARLLYLEGTRTHLHPSPRVLEVGFGLGVNFRVSLESAQKRGVRLTYLAVEKELLSEEVLAFPLGLASDPLFFQILRGLPGPVEGAWGRLVLLLGDVRGVELPKGFATAIYLDPFSPKVNPEAWGLEVMKKLWEAALPGARLATYSAAGWVRRNLRRAGFQVEALPSPWKRSWTVGIALETPLG